MNRIIDTWRNGCFRTSAIPRIKMVHLLHVSVSKGGAEVIPYIEYPTAVGIMGNQKCHVPTYITALKIPLLSLLGNSERRGGGGGECCPHDSNRAGLFSPKLN